MPFFIRNLCQVLIEYVCLCEVSLMAVIKLQFLEEAYFIALVTEYFYIVVMVGQRH